MKFQVKCCFAQLLVATISVKLAWWNHLMRTSWVCSKHNYSMISKKLHIIMLKQINFSSGSMKVFVMSAEKSDLNQWVSHSSIFTCKWLNAPVILNGRIFQKDYNKMNETAVLFGMYSTMELWMWRDCARVALLLLHEIYIFYSTIEHLLSD